MGSKAWAAVAIFFAMLSAVLGTLLLTADDDGPPAVEPVSVHASFDCEFRSGEADDARSERCATEMGELLVRRCERPDVGTVELAIGEDDEVRTFFCDDVREQLG